MDEYKVAVREKIFDLLYELSLARYSDQYSSQSYHEDIRTCKTKLFLLAEIVNQFADGVVPKTYVGYCGYEIYTENLGFEYFID